MEKTADAYLSEARRQLTTQRNDLIKSLSRPFVPEQSHAHLEMIIKIQQAIEILDKVAKNSNEPR